MFLAVLHQVLVHLGSLESTEEARVPLGYHLEKFLHFFHALQTSNVHHTCNSKEHT